MIRFLLYAGLVVSLLSLVVAGVAGFQLASIFFGHYDPVRDDGMTKAAAEQHTLLLVRIVSVAVVTPLIVGPCCIWLYGQMNKETRPGSQGWWL